MFPTTRARQRYHPASAAVYQRESSPPPPGAADSCYGVKSMSSDWGVDSESGQIPAAHDQQHDVVETDDQEADEGLDEEGEDVSTPEGQDEPVGLGITPVDHSALLQWSASNAMNTGIDNHDANTSLIADAEGTAAAHTRVIPPSPEDTVHPLDSTAHRLDLIDSPYLPTSEPSSPASFTSMPSYVASLSSLSRTSSVSPLEENEHGHHYHYAHGDRAFHHAISGSAGGEDLVLPTLSLPSESLSLHMSLRKWVEGDTQDGFKVIIVGGREMTEKTLKCLKGSCELVELGKGIVGVIKDDKVVMRLVTGLSHDQAKERVDQAYHNLNRLLHPDLPRDDTAKLEFFKLVSAYAISSDWVHQVIALDDFANDKARGAEPSWVHNLDQIVPVAVVTAAVAREPISDDIPSSAHHGGEVEPTPRPTEELADAGYFAPRVSTPSPSSSREVSPDRSSRSPCLAERAADILCRLVDNSDDVLEQSTRAFCEWRTSQAKERSIPDVAAATMASSITSTSAASSSSYGVGGVGPMPTVARAQGGGEWEATLSRRIAQRKELEPLTSDQGSEVRNTGGRGTLHPPRGTKGRVSNNLVSSGSGRGRRRRSFERERERERERKCLPLFPPMSSSNSRGKSLNQSGWSIGIGLGGLVEKTFETVRWGTTSWRGVVLACAVAVAVGWGCWISRR